MNAIDLDSFEDIKDISFDLGPSSNKGSSRPNLITRDPPSRSPTNDSSFGLDLIMNKDKQKRKPSPRSSPSFSPIPLDEPKSSFSDNMYSKIDNKTPSFGSGGGSKFNMDAYLEDELADLTSKPSITKMGGSNSSSPIELLPPSGNGFNFDDDILGDNSNSNQNQNQNNYSNSNSNSNSNQNQNNYSNSNSNNNQNSYQQDNYNSNSNSDDRPMSVEEMQRKKFDLLCKLERLKKKGVIVPRTYTMNSNYEEIKYEYEKLHNERLMDNSVKMYRQMLISTTTAIEYLNTKANPFDFYLDGWSDQVHSQQHDYDEIFEEIYEKYKDRGSMAPELRLLMALGGSAFMYHLSNTMFKSVLPGAQDILRQNPDLMKHMQQTLLSTMAQQGPTEATFAGMMGGAMNRDSYNPTQGSPSAGMRTSNPPSNSNNGNRRQMSGPDGLDTFLDDITGGNKRNVDL